VQPKAIKGFEKQYNVLLPHSYRAYCEIFGPGEFGMRFKIAAPGYQGEATTFSLEKLQQMTHVDLEYQLYSKDPEQHKRGIFFGLDSMGSYYFFDPAETTDEDHHEYAIYKLSSDLEIVQSCGTTFCQYITDFCLGDKLDQLGYETPTEHVFMPVG